jgi:hypothetical protein
MRTDDLIEIMVHDMATAPALPRAELQRWLLPALLAALAGIVVVLGLRADLTAALSATGMKWSLGVVIAGVGLFAALYLARPEAGSRAPLMALAAVPAAAAVLIIAGGSAAPFSFAALKCLLAVPLTAALPLAALLVALRQGAVTRPALAGGFAGLAAAGLAIPIYALHCTEDGAGFVGVWYVAAAVLTVVAGAIAGSRVLRW